MEPFRVFPQNYKYIVCMCVLVCSAPQQTEASHDFLKSCSADEVSCTAEVEASESGGGEEGERAASLPLPLPLLANHDPD